MTIVLRRNWSAKGRAATAAVTILALLFFALKPPPEIDDRILSTEVADVSIVHGGSELGGRVQIASSAECHFENGCIPEIMPSLGSDIDQFNSASQTSGLTKNHASRITRQPYHPPQFFSQV